MADFGMNYTEWQVPPAITKEGFRNSEGRILGWCSEAKQEGGNWLKGQRGYSDMRKAMDIISGKMASDVAEYRSRLNSNQLKHNVREVVGTLSDIRPLWGYHSDNPALLAQAEMMNKTTRAIYLQNFFDRDIRKALQYAAGTCTGYIRPVYSRDLGGTGKGDIKLKAYGAPCVLPVQMPADNDLQNAYAVTIIDEVPVFQAHAMWPEFQDRLRPTTNMFWYSQELRVPQSTNMFRRIWGKVAGKTSGQADLLCEVNYTYVVDLSINTTDHIVSMGEEGTSWHYNVPFLGMDIPVGIDEHGQFKNRKATITDCRLYPRRRLLIHTETTLLYDGPSFDWHGRVPIVPFCMDDWPWEGIGFSMVRDGYQQQQAIDEIDRGMQDMVRARLNISLAFDENAVSKREAQRFDPMEPRSRIAFDGTQVSKPFELPIPLEVLQFPQEIPAQRDYYAETMNKQMGLRDMLALARARASGSGDDLEKLMEAQGPIVKDISRTMERSMRDLGEMIKYLILQYYTTSRVMRLVGPDGVTQETFDYDPNSLIPSHMPGENPDKSSFYNTVERARLFAESLTFFITPNSLHAITQMSRQLLYLQLKKAGFPIDSRTIAEAMDIPNFGNKPDGNTVLERWMSEQEMQLELASRMAQLKNGLPGLQPPPSPVGPTPPPVGQKPQEGRPSSFTAAPTLETKDGGARTTIVTSK